MIYINDITHLTLFNGSMTLFADDIMIYRPICTSEDLAMSQSDIDSLTSWTTQNFLQFNADKCKGNFQKTSNKPFPGVPASTSNIWYCHEKSRQL